MKQMKYSLLYAYNAKFYLLADRLILVFTQAGGRKLLFILITSVTHFFAID